MNNIIVKESSSNIRLLARQAMDGQWKKVTGAVLIYLVCILVPVVLIEVLFGSLSAEALEAAMYGEEEMTSGSVIGSLYSVLVEGAFAFGMAYYFLQMIRSRVNDLGNVFSGFGYYFKTLGLYLMISLKTLLWMLLLIVPGIIAALRYSQAFYILADDPGKGIMQCINESKALMKGNKAKILCLQLSYAPWALLAYFAFLLITVAATSLSIFVPAAGVVGIIIVVIGFICFMIAIAVVMAYMMGGLTVFYEMVTGRLRPAGEPIPAPENTEL